MSYRNKGKSELREWIQSAVIAIILALIIKNFIFEFVLVDGNSMFPTLENNDRLVVTKAQYYFIEPDYGDIITLKYSSKVEFVKRIVAKAGDTVEIKNSILYINGEAVEEPYINNEEYGDFDRVIVPENSYFVLGDNRRNSRDSRYNDVGYINENDIEGKVVYRIYPFDKLGKVQ